MQEELLIKIKADISDMKKGVDETKKSLDGAEKETKNLKSKISAHAKEMGKQFEKLGNTIGKAIKAGCVIAAGAIAAIFKASWDNYKDYEQYVGGIEKLYGDASDTVMKTAQQTYATTGMTANQYLDTATAFSAALIRELGGDQAKAAEMTDMIVQDIADNVSVYGGSVEEVSGWMQSLAKGNYQVLDNFNLGFKGTTGGVKELIAEAERLDSTFRASRDANGDYAMDFVDIAQAIHIVQDDLGITGNSAEELSKTLSGSVSLMKGAWGNFVTSLMDDEWDVSETTAALIDSVKTFLENAIPLIKEFAEGLVTGIHDALDEYPALQSVFDKVIEIIKNIADTIKNVADWVVEHWDIVKPILEALAIVIGVITAAVIAFQVATKLAALGPCTIIITVITAIIAVIIYCIQHWDEIKEKVTEVWNAMKAKISETVENIKQKIEDFKTSIHDKFEEIKTNISEKIEAAKQAVTDKFEQIKTNIKQKVEEAKQAVIDKFQQIKDGIKDKIEEAKSAVREKFEAIKSAIQEKVSAAKENVLTAFTNIKTGITDRIEGARQAVIDKFTAIKTGIKEKIDAARDAVRDAIEKIKGFFNFSWSLPKLKMPHISVSGKFSLNPPSAPSFGISWYAKGGVFDNPALFSFGNRLGGLGENGAEAIVPLENNTEWLTKIADMLNDRQGGKQIVLTVDGKTFAQTAITSINSLTNQTGNLGLVIR